MFGNTYLCEQFFSHMQRKIIFEISGWRYINLLPLMRLAETQTLNLKLIYLIQVRIVSCIKIFCIGMRQQNTTVWLILCRFCMSVAFEQMSL